MFSWLIHLFIDSLVLLGASRFMPKVHVKSFSTAVFVAILIGILSFLIGWIFTLILNVATLGMFYFLGLGFITRIISYAIVIELVDQLTTGFKTDGFMASLWLAILLAIVGAIVDWVIL